MSPSTSRALVVFGLNDYLLAVLALLKPSTWRNPYKGVAPLDLTTYSITAEVPIDLPHDHVWED